MWELIKKKKKPPRIKSRYCCESQKESGGEDRFIITGIRYSESTNRSKRKRIEHCYKNKSKKYLNLIIDWTTTDVWQYIRKQDINYCCLYDEGFKRIGCVLCPMNRDVALHIRRWPSICRAWERAIKATFKRELPGFNNAEEYWQWWLSRKSSAKKYDDEMYLW